MNQHLWTFMMVGTVAVQAALGIGVEAPSQEKEEELEFLSSQQKASETLGKIRTSLYGYRGLIDMIYSNSNLGKDYDIRVIHQTNIPEDAVINITLRGTDLRSCANIGWESRYIGFPNWLKYVEGHMQFQQFENMKLRLELLRLKGATPAEVKQLEDQVTDMRNSLADNYLGETNWVD